MRENKFPSDYNPVALVGLVVSALAILPLPIEFYGLIRIIICGAASLFALKRYSTYHPIWFLFFAEALVFNPIFPVYLDNKFLWIVIDILSALLFYTQLNDIGDFSHQDASAQQDYRQPESTAIIGKTDTHYPSVRLSRKSNDLSLHDKISRHLAKKTLSKCRVETLSAEGFADFFLNMVFPIVAEWHKKETYHVNINSTYFLGYLYGFLGMVTICLSKREPLTTENKGEISLKFMNRIDRILDTNFGFYLQNPCHAQNIIDQSEYIRAQEDVAIWSRSLLGMDFESSSTAIIASSKRLAELQEIDLPTAIFINTFCKYFRVKL